MQNLAVFALLGLLAGAASPTGFRGRRSERVFGTAAIGVSGALVGGMISEWYWPLTEGQFRSGNLAVAILGAMAAITLLAGMTYVRRFRSNGDAHDRLRH